MLTCGMTTESTIPILELKEFSKCALVPRQTETVSGADFLVPLFVEVVCGLHADIDANRFLRKKKETGRNLHLMFY